MQTEFLRHQEVMKLFSIFHNEIHTRNLDFEKHFGIERIYAKQPESEERLINIQNQDINEVKEDHSGENNIMKINKPEGNSELNNRFEAESIPLELTKEEYSIYSMAEMLLRKSMREKNRNKKGVMHREIFCLLISYFLNK